MTSQHVDLRSPRLQAVFCLLIVVGMWGVQPLLLKLIMERFSPSFTGTCRALIAALVFGAMMLRARRRGSSADEPFSTSRDRFWLIVGGVTLGLSNVAWNSSFRLTTVAAASVLQLSGSITVALAGIVLLKERCTTARLLGLATALVGMFLISWNGHDLSALTSSAYFKGNLCSVASGIGWAASALSQRMVLQGRSSVSIIAPMLALSAGTCAIGMVFLPGAAIVLPFSIPMFLLIILTGILGLGLGNHLVGHSMRVLPASVAAATLTGSPLISLLFAALFLHEPVTSYLLLGAPLTCAGVALAVLTKEG